MIWGKDGDKQHWACRTRNGGGNHQIEETAVVLPYIAEVTMIGSALTTTPFKLQYALAALFLSVALGTGTGAYAVDGDSAEASPTSPGAMKSENSIRPAPSDKPMPIKMKKEGMMQGDVKKAGKNWDQKMKDKMKQEEKAASQRGLPR